MKPLTDTAVFCEVVRQGSFTAAAAALHLSKGAVSKFVSRLEAQLGVRLLNRTTRRLTLTQAGEIFHARASRALAELQEAEREVSEHADRPRGHLRISAPTFYGAEVLAAHLAQFHARFPDISLELTLDNRMVDLVQERFDVAIRIAAPRDSSLVMRKLSDVPIVTCASPAYLRRCGRPMRPDQLPRHQCLIYTLDSRPQEWTFVRPDGRHYSVAVDGPFRFNDDHVIRRAALDGLGILRMPKLFVEDALQRGDLQQLWPDSAAPRLALAAVYPSRRDLPTKVRTFVDFMVERSAPARS